MSFYEDGDEDDHGLFPGGRNLPGSEVTAFVPGMMRATQCRAQKKVGGRCRNYAVGGTGLCAWHGGNGKLARESAARRMEQVRAELFDVLVDAASDAVETYTGIMRNGRKDSDRLRAADRVLQLLGLAPQDAVVQVHVEQGPAGDDIDTRLRELLGKVAAQGAGQVLEATSTSSADQDQEASS